MRIASPIGIILICSIAFLLGVSRWSAIEPTYAQQSSQPYDDGNVYVFTAVDVDSSYYLYTDSFAELDFDADEDIDGVQDEIQVDEDQDVFFDDFADPDQDYSEYPSLMSNSPVARGHEYGVLSNGWVCIDDGEGDCEWESEDYAYAYVEVTSPLPQIVSLSTYSVTQGDTGTLTVTGTNLVESSGDQLTISLAGSSAPFTLTGTPTSTTATFSYNFTSYPAGTYTLSVTNNEGTSNGQTFTVTAAPPPPPPPPDPCAVSTNPRSGYTYIVPTGTVGGSGTMSVSFSGASFSNLSPTTVPYGPYSTPSSIASNLAALITKNYAQNGVFARAFGSNIIYGGIAALGSVSNIATGSSFTTEVSSTAANTAAAACYTIPHIPCLGLWPNYDTPRLYASEGITETPRQHIIRRHISNTPSLGPPQTTVYANTVGTAPDQVFSIVQTYNFHTVLQGHPGKGGGLDYTFPTRTVGGVTFGLIGIDGSGINLQTNHFVLSPDKCSVITSFPIAP
jgi:hypothetical protein